MAAALQVCWFHPPDVWMQLLQHFLRDTSCRQALLGDTGSTAAPELALMMLGQLGAALAEELAASSIDIDA